MSKKKTLIIFIITVAFVSFISTVVNAQTNNKLTDYLHVPGPVSFNSGSYNLSWSSHPSDNFYKQEYIQKGDNADKFKTMILIDVATSNISIKDIVAMKIEELKKMKLSNPMVNYETFDNPKSGEYMIDFLLSANAADGKTIDVVERNVYRYKTITDKSGKKAVVLFGVSTRSYGNDIDKFLVSLKSTKKDLVNVVAKFEMPAISF
ncbi:MAG: hypothetical protein ABI402_19070 [Ferruginibacter sp.]